MLLESRKPFYQKQCQFWVTFLVLLGLSKPEEEEEEEQRGEVYFVMGAANLKNASKACQHERQFLHVGYKAATRLLREHRHLISKKNARAADKMLNEYFVPQDNDPVLCKFHAEIEECIVSCAKKGRWLVIDDFFRGDKEGKEDIELHMDRKRKGNAMINCFAEGKEYIKFANCQTDIVLRALDMFETEEDVKVKVTSFWGLASGGEVVRCGAEADCQTPVLLQRGQHISHRLLVGQGERLEYYRHAADVFTWRGTVQQREFVLQTVQRASKTTKHSAPTSKKRKPKRGEEVQAKKKQR